MAKDFEPAELRAREKTSRDEAEASAKCLYSLGRQGWIGVAFWMTLGFLLEGLLAYKTPIYLSDPQRRELFRLAHAHGTGLSLLLVLAALWLQKRSGPPRRPVLLALRIGTLLIPVGFVLAGVWHFETDPGYAIWFVPVGALLTIFGTISVACSKER